MTNFAPTTPNVARGRRRAGVVSPLGLGMEATATLVARAVVTASLRSRDSPSTQCRCQTAGQVPDAWLELQPGPSHRAKRLHRVARMMIVALAEALAQEPAFKPELTVVGTTSGGMTFGEEYYRALHTHRTSAPSAVPDRQLHAAEADDGRAGSTRHFRTLPGDRERLRIRHERDRPCIRMRPLRPLPTRPHRWLRRDLGAGLRRLRFAAGGDAGEMPAVRSRAHRNGARAKVRRSSRWKISRPRKHAAQPFSRKSSATASRPTTITSPSQTLPAAARARPWSARLQSAQLAASDDRLHQRARHRHAVQRRGGRQGDRGALRRRVPSVPPRE